MFSPSFLKEEYYYSLNLKGGKIFLGSKWYLNHNWVFCNIEFDHFSVEIRRVIKYWFSRNIFEIRLRDKSNIMNCPFSGPYAKTISTLFSSKKFLLEKIQCQINLVERYNKLKVFL